MVEECSVRHDDSNYRSCNAGQACGVISLAPFLDSMAYEHWFLGRSSKSSFKV